MPVVEVAFQRHDVLSELMRLHIIVRPPRGGPVLSKAEAEVTADVGPGRDDICLRSGVGRLNRKIGRRIEGSLVEAGVNNERIVAPDLLASRTRVELNHVAADRLSWRG